jgi:hypothetical protein
VILARLIFVIAALVFIAWLIGGLTRDRTTRRRRRRNTSR